MDDTSTSITLLGEEPKGIKKSASGCKQHRHDQ
jgi:hypothetical protein